MLYNPNFPFINQIPQQNNQGTYFIPIHSEDEILNYPVAPGNSVYFKHESQPFIYTKTMGMSQFETPKYTKHQLTEVPMTMANPIASQPIEEKPKYLVSDDLKPIFDEIAMLQKETEDLKALIPKVPTKANTKTTDNVPTVAKEK